MSSLRKKSGYLPGLDGWRALAILGVMMAHDHPLTIFGHSNVAYKVYGGWGIYLFFAISGYLICTRILEDERLTGRFHLKGFYIRRLFRIQPAALTYLTALAILITVGINPDHWRSWTGALFLYTNFLYRAADGAAAGFFTGHFWTLAVEEHFYIVLSLLLYFVRRKRAAAFAVLLIVILTAQRYGVSHGYVADAFSSRRTYWVIQMLLIPAFLALLLQNHRIKLLCAEFLRPWVAFAGTAVVFLLWTMHDFGIHGIPRVVREPAFEPAPILYGFSFWIISTTLHPGSLSTRLLETSPLRFVGRISYSLYLWHVLFFVPTHPEVGVTSPALLYAAGRPMKYVLTFAFACLSYYLIEKPLIRYGHALAPPATPGHKDLAVDIVTSEDSGSAAILRA